MPDLETRLRAAGQRPISAPDFDAALRRAKANATATARYADDHAAHRAVHSRSARPWLAAAAAVLALIAAAAALTLAGGRDNRSSGPAASHADSHSVSFTPRIAGMILSPDDTNKQHPQYMIFATSPRATPPKRTFSTKPHAAANDCVDFPDVKVIETATQIRLRAVVLHRASGGFRCETQGLPDPRSGNLLAGGVDALKRPLGNRTVVDDRTGEPVKVFVPTYPRPQHVPAGYAAMDAHDTEPMGTTWSDPRPGFLAPMSVARTYGPTDGPNKGEPGLVVVEAPYDTVNPGATLVDHVSVSGHRATVTDISTARCITWSPDGHSGLQVCSDVKRFTSGTRDPLSENELLQVARTLP